jgi:hypothetical protein
MQPLNIVIQSAVVDLLQAIVARGEVSNLSVEIIEATVIDKLYFCVHVRRLDLQNKLLHLLHSVISASTSNQETIPNRTSKGTQRPEGESENRNIPDDLPEPGMKPYSVNPLLIQTLIDGISTPSNRAVLQHWLDFVLMAIPQFQPALQIVLAPLNDCICRQLRLSLTDILRASSDEHDNAQDVSSATTDAELIILLNGLERLTLLSLADRSETDQPEEEPSMEKTGQDNSGLLGYVSNVFSSENAPNMMDDLLTVSFYPSA